LLKKLLEWKIKRILNKVKKVWLIWKVQIKLKLFVLKVHNYKLQMSHSENMICEALLNVNNLGFWNSLENQRFREILDKNGVTA